MQTLSQPAVMKRAALAAMLTAVAACPRLVLWQERSAPLALLVVLLALISFVMWGFVFAWIPQHGRIELFPKLLEVRVWGAATLAGLAGGGLLWSAFDPSLRRLLPQDYPDSANAWQAAALFHLAFVQLFLSFAPFAFFVRLLGHRHVAAALTVLFGVVLLLVQANAAEVELSRWLVAAMVGFRILTGGLGMYLLFRGGLIPVWWSSLLIQSRLLLELDGPD